MAKKYNVQFCNYDPVSCDGMTGGKHAPVMRNILNNISGTQCYWE
jgi:hypothetical protein